MDGDIYRLLTNWPFELSSFASEPSRSFISGFLASKGVASAKIFEFPTQIGTKKVISSSPDNGFGITQYSDGTLYIGGVLNGQREGHGVRSYAGKALIYIGDYTRGKKSGRGKLLSLADGQVLYDGEWRDDAKEGQGVLVYEKGTYEGYFKGDIFHGRGKLTWKGGDVYDGAFFEGQRTGYGVLRFPNGDAYEGEFLNGMFNGKGVYRWATGESYAGSFESGQAVGTGVVNYQVNAQGGSV